MNLPPVATFPRLRAPLEEAAGSLSQRLRIRLTWKSAENDYWRTIQGLLLSSCQGFDAVCRLLFDGRALVSPSVAVARSLFEGFGNVLSLREDGEYRTRLFLMDAYREDFKAAAEAHTTASNRYLAGLADHLRLSEAQRKDPERNLRSWPTPSKLLTGSDGRERPWLSGSGRAAFELLKAYWYAEYSRVVHQKDLAVSGALRTELGEPHTVAEAARIVFFVAALFHLCLLSEVEEAGRWGNGPILALRRSWGLLSTSIVPVIEVYALRYGDLFGPYLQPADLEEGWDRRFG